jgi:hypothetical protein
MPDGWQMTVVKINSDRRGVRLTIAPTVLTIADEVIE